MKPSRTILLIEEDRDLRKLLRDLLETMDCCVIATPGAESVPRVFEMAATADLLVSDVTVPGSDSIELTEMLLARCPDLGAVLISTSDAEFEARRRFESGRTRFLRKPFSIEELKETVAEATKLKPEVVRAPVSRPAAVAGRGSPRRLRAAWGLAAAAVLVLAAGVLFSSTGPAPPLPDSVASTVVRGSPLQVLAPKGDLPEMPAQLSWEADPEAAGYRIRILAVDDTVVWQGESRRATAALSPQALAALDPGVVYFWTVAALDARGEVRRSSETARFQVVPPRAQKTESETW